MSELEKLKRALDEGPTAPRPEARDAAIAAALDAYDADNAEARQGTGLLDRLRNAARAASETITGRRPMSTMTLGTRRALYGGASIAVILIAATAVISFETLERMPRVTAPVSRDEDSATASAPQPEAAAARQDGGDEMADAGELLPDVSPSPSSAESQVAIASAESEAAPPVAAAPPMPSAQYDVAGDAAANFAARPRLAEKRAAATAQGGMLAATPAPEAPAAAYQDQGRDRFTTIETNPVHVTAEDPVSTFSIDVDSSSYSFMRAALNNGVLPPDDSVRVEELINYFPYDYPGPDSAQTPFKATATIMPTPWNAQTKLLNIGIKGYDIATAERPRANLVFLIDTSGSMQETSKLPLLINSMKLLVDELKPDDTVAIVTYAGNAGTLLEPTHASQKGKILAALEGLSAGGSTAGAEGIRQAYRLAEQSFDKNGVNRVILATDGDFNVGITNMDELQGFVERERESGIFLSVLGFGRGNYNDALMQALAQNGNGAAAYIDTLNEARKVLVDESTSTLFPIAKDVKLQVEFNPATVSEYRLIGYENRLLNREDFNNDKVDAGEIGSGHTVTAIYEITPAGSPAALVDDLRYKSEAKPAAGAASDEYAFLKIRYKLPEEETSRLIETPITTADEVGASGGGVPAREARFAASVAAFGQLLRGGRYTGDYSYDDVIALAQANKGDDPFGYRAEFVNLVRLAKSAASMEQLQRQ